MVQILLKLLHLQIRYHVNNNISANRKRQRQKHITQRFAGGEKPFGKTTPPLQNLHNVLSQNRITIHLQCKFNFDNRRHQQQLTIPTIHSFASHLFVTLKMPISCASLLGLLPKVNCIRVLPFSEKIGTPKKFSTPQLGQNVQY